MRSSTRLLSVTALLLACALEVRALAIPSVVGLVTTDARRASIRVATKTSSAIARSLKSFSVTLPEPSEGRPIRNRVTLDIEINTDGSVGRIRQIKSSGSSALDTQILDGVKTWRFDKQKRKLFLYLTLVIDI